MQCVVCGAVPYVIYVHDTCEFVLAMNAVSNNFCNLLNYNIIVWHIF